MAVKKEGWGGGGTRTLSFACSGSSEFSVLAPSSKTLKITICQGLSKETRTFLMYLSKTRLTLISQIPGWFYYPKIVLRRSSERLLLF